MTGATPRRTEPHHGTPPDQPCSGAPAQLEPSGRGAAGWARPARARGLDRWDGTPAGLDGRAVGPVGRACSQGLDRLDRRDGALAGLDRREGGSAGRGLCRGLDRLGRRKPDGLVPGVSTAGKARWPGSTAGKGCKPYGRGVSTSSTAGPGSRGLGPGSRRARPPGRGAGLARPPGRGTGLARPPGGGPARRGWARGLDRLDRREGLQAVRARGLDKLDRRAGVPGAGPGVSTSSTAGKGAGLARPPGWESSQKRSGGAQPTAHFGGSP